jgi:hypothetical protein
MLTPRRRGSIFSYTISLYFVEISLLFEKHFKQTLKLIFCYIHLLSGGTVAELVEALRYKPEGRGLHCRWPHYGPGVDSTFNRNEY